MSDLFASNGPMTLKGLLTVLKRYGRSDVVIVTPEPGTVWFIYTRPTPPSDELQSLIDLRRPMGVRMNFHSVDELDELVRRVRESAFREGQASMLPPEPPERLRDIARRHLSAALGRLRS